jgi:sugar phosphate isomerase/epimerase
MRIGVSIYSLCKEIESGRMDVLDVIEWIAQEGGEHVEIVPIGFDLHSSPELIDRIIDKARQTGIEISNYAVGGNLIVDSDEAFEREIARLKKDVDIAHRLGVKRMRHDVASHPDTSIRHFNERLSRLAEGCRIIADYASHVV